jgi:hypothetical protein
METRFMQVMYSATENQDAELTNQVANDIEVAKQNGQFEDDEVTYVNLGSGKVLVVDKENGESTIIEEDPEDAEGYSLEGYENPDAALEKFLHPEDDGVTPDENVQTEETENVEVDHLGGQEISESVEDKTVEENAIEGNNEVCPECGNDPCTCEEEEEEQHEYSNTAMAKLFSDPDFYLKLFSDVVTEDKPAIVGDLKIEVDEDNPDTIVVTDIESGDAAQVNTDEDGEVIVNELQKECSEDEDFGEQYDPLYVVGVNEDTNELVDAQVYGEEAAEELAQRYQEIGVEGIGIFEDQLEAQEHAANLLGELGITELEAHAEPEEHTFSDWTEVSVFTTKFFSDEEIEKHYSETVSSFMERMFSEEEQEITDSQDIIEDAIESGEQVEDGNLVITPISNDMAVVADKDNGEYTKVTVEEDTLDMDKISEEEADELTKDIEVGDGEEKAYSEYELKLNVYSDVQDEVADAIESGEEVENDGEIITPISEDTAIVFDKENNEYTKVVLDENKDLETDNLSEEEAEDEIKKAEAEAEEAKKVAEEEKKYSVLNKFFADAVVDPETGDPVEEAAPVEAAGAEEIPQTSVEGIEDKALEAVQSIQEAANNAVLAIQEAKEAPAPGEEEDLKEAHFSETTNNDTLGSWLNNI